MTWKRNDISNMMIVILAIVITWGCITFRYVSNGFTYALWAFIVSFGIILWHTRSKPQVKISINITRALLILYGTLLVVGILQYDNIYNFWGRQYSAVDLFFITLPLWMVLIIGWNYDLRKWIGLTIWVNMWAFSVYGFWQYFIKSQNRLASFYGSPPEVGMLLDLLIPCTITLGIYYKEKTLYHWTAVPLVLLECIALFLNKTRGSYLALSVALIVTGGVWLYYQKNRIAMKLKLAICGCIIAFVCAAAGYTLLIGSESHSRMVGGERLLMWESSYHMWKDHKILGIGLSEWKEQYNNPDSPYRPAEGRETTNIMPHNIFLYFLATGGIVSFVAFLGYLFFMMKYLLSVVKQYANNPFSWMMLFIFIAFISHGLVDGTIISRHIGRIFYLLLGIGILFTERWTHRDAS